MDRRRAAGLSEATLKTNGLIFEKHLDPYLGGIRVGDLSPCRLDEWRRELEAAGASTHMLNRSKVLIGQILADARRLDLVAVNAARGLPTVRRRARRGRTATPEQVEAMRASFLDRGQRGHATMRGRPSTSIAEAISATRNGQSSGESAGYEALARPARAVPT